MKTILDTIKENKVVEVLTRKARKPLEALEKMPLYSREVLDAVGYFSNERPGIIAEFKRKSPSKGLLAKSLTDPVKVVRSYKEGGAVCSSVLTDRNFFGGSFKDLEQTKMNVPGIPLLRKDFIIDHYQVHETKAYGADIILLIAAILSKEDVKSMARLADSLGLSVLLEVHTREELDKWDPSVKLVGMNNRNLKDFSVDIERSLAIVDYMPAEVVKISESGLANSAEILKLHNAGYNGFLMGERFMTQDDPGRALADLINELNE